MAIRVPLDTVKHLLSPEEAEALSRKPDRPSGRKDAGDPNQTERAFAADWLEPRRLAGTIAKWEYEAETIVLSERMGCTYLPDYRVKLADESKEYYEVKNSCRGTSRGRELTKVKWAADLMWPTPFYVALASWDKRTKRYRWKVRRLGVAGSPA
jgi:hypothetical protein